MEKGKEYDYVSSETNRLFCEEVGFDLKRTFLFYSSSGMKLAQALPDTDIKDLPAGMEKSCRWLRFPDRQYGNPV